MSVPDSSFILGSVVIISGTTLARNAVQKHNHIGPVIFGFLLATALLGIAIFAPTFARGLAMLGMVGAFAVNGPTLFTLTKKLGQ